MGDIERLSFNISSTAAMYLTAVIFFAYAVGKSAIFCATNDGAVQMTRSNRAYEPPPDNSRCAACDAASSANCKPYAAPFSTTTRCTVVLQ